MEQNNIDIAELLKDCERGTKLYSPICGECEFDGITELGYISVLFDNQESGWDFDKYGYLCDDTEHKGECLFFPSKEVRDWGCFHVKYVRGIEGKEEELKQLLDNNGCTNSIPYHCTDPDVIYYIDSVDGRLKALFLGNEVEKVINYVLSTGTELKLEEERPKFKVGDVVIRKGEFADTFILTENEEEATGYNIPISLCNLYTYSLATDIEIAVWNEQILHPNHLHYSTNKRKIIHWFLPFDKVVVRFEEDKSVNWIASFYSHFNGKDFVCIDGTPYAQCLPYNEETARLIGTTDDYKEDE